MKLRNVIFKTKNIIIQEVNKATDCRCKTCIIMGCGYSLSVDEKDNIIHRDLLFFPLSGKEYGDYTVLSVFYPFECDGLSAAARELANYINNNLQQYENIVLHGHSKCGSCFIETTKWLKRKVTIVSVSAPLNKQGTPMANRKLFDARLNWVEKRIFHTVFHNHNVDKDLCENSKFLTNLSIDNLQRHNYLIIVSVCDRFTLNPVELLLTWIDKSKGIQGDGIIPKNTQLPKGKPFTQISSSHANSMKNSVLFVKNLL